jgi:hypothetical protein
LHILFRNGVRDYEYFSSYFLLIKKLLQCGADLQAKDAAGETVLDAAAHWRVHGEDGGNVWDLRPVLLYLQRECEDTGADQTKFQLKDIAGKAIPDLAGYWADKKASKVEVMEKLRHILSQLEEGSQPAGVT